MSKGRACNKLHKHLAEECVLSQQGSARSELVAAGHSIGSPH